MAVVCCLRFCVYILCVVCIYCILLIAHTDAGMQVTVFSVLSNKYLNHRHQIGCLLRCLKLPTLNYRRIRGDMIELYKIITGKYDSNCRPVWVSGPKSGIIVE